MSEGKLAFGLSRRTAQLRPSATAEISNVVKRMKRQGISDVVSLDVGEPCFDTPPNIKWAAWEALQAGKTAYEPTAGDYELRDEICQKLKRDNAITVDVDDIIVTPGAKFAIYLAFQAVLEKGDRVMLLDPAWVSYEPIAKIAGADAVRVPTFEADGFQPDLAAVEEAMDDSVKIVVVNSPCNPTGAVYDEVTIRTIVELAKGHETLVLSDEIYEYLIYEGRHYSPASEFDNVITVNGFSKTYAMTGWRLGYVTAPKEILKGMLKIYQHSVTCVTAFAQAGAIEALRSEESQQAVKRMVEGYKERRAVMLELIQQSEFFDLSVEPQGAFYCFPSYRLKKPSVEFAKELLEEVHVATVPGAAFGECGEGHLRLSYATSVENIVEAFERIESYLRKKA
ncbi:MAG: pyridoxal phosphate-dependent aminotransferase [Thermotogae bacterium]|nr:MAG: pyridoxal phosphate-dependent aminotransferase [Thermotogota bacterium]